MKIKVHSPLPQYAPLELTCHLCKSVLEIEEKDWRKGDCGSEMVVACPVCKAELVKPGTEYQGDF
jgi:NAD-dependent SIR2 family protein deacetylase